MEIDHIIKYPDSRLTRKADPIKLLTNSKKRRLIKLFDLMYEEGGVGLAAPQVGWGVRAFILGFKQENNPNPVELIFINPIITDYSIETVKMEEGCLSLDGVSLEVERPKQVTIKAMNIDGKMFTLTADDLIARCIQHEYDHLDGKLLIDFET